MYFTFGSYSTPSNSSWFDLAYTAIYGPRGTKIGEDQRWTIHTVLIGSSQSALDTLITDHEAGMRSTTGDLTFFKDDGSETAHKILSAQTQDGIKFMGISYPGYLPGLWGSGTEYVNLRYAVTRHRAFVFDTEDNIIDYWQGMMFSLGGYDYAVPGAFVGPPQFQITQLQAPFEAVQRGRAIGLFSNPGPGSPLVNLQPKPGLHNSYVDPQSPKNFGRIASWGYPTYWQYRFLSPGPLNAIPPASHS